MTDSGGPKQHVDAHRKLGIRRDLLRFALPGAVYVPFCGDGDIAADVYADRPICAADLGGDRVATTSARLPDAEVVRADVDKSFPFAGRPDDAEPFAVADFDAWVHPYAAFKLFWQTAKRTDRTVMFFTDGHRDGIKRSKVLLSPDGSRRRLAADEWRRTYNFYWIETVLPWLTAAVAPWLIVREVHYLRDDELYFGVVVDAPGYAGTDMVAAQPDRRREKFDETRKAAYLDLLRQGESRLIAHRKVGIDRRTESRHAIRYPAFALARDEAEMEASGEIENALYMAAKSGNVVAIQVWLYNRAPERWTDRRGAVNVNVNVSLRAEAERLAVQLGCTVEEVLREAEALVSGP